MTTAMYYSPGLAEKLGREGLRPAVILAPGGKPTLMTESVNDVPLTLFGDDEPWRNVVTLKSVWKDAVLVYQGEFSKNDAVMLVDERNRLTMEGAAYAIGHGLDPAVEAIRGVAERRGPAHFPEIADKLTHGAGKSFHAPKPARFHR